jgi:hypothetical protein
MEFAIERINHLMVQDEINFRKISRKKKKNKMLKITLCKTLTDRYKCDGTVAKLNHIFNSRPTKRIQLLRNMIKAAEDKRL